MKSPRTIEPSREDMKAIRRGARLLDEKVPGWREHIEPAALKMGVCQKCIVGQALGLGRDAEDEYESRLTEWFGTTYDDDLDVREEEHGFSARSVFGWDALQAAWVGYLQGEWR